MLISTAQAQIFFLALTRILAILVQIPIFSGSMVPNLVKVGFGFVLALVIIPWKPLSPETAAMSLLPFGAAILQELVIGLLAGFAATLTFGAFQITGKLMDISSGFGSGQIFNPALGETGSALDQFFMLVVMIFFLITNGHHIFFMGLKATFAMLPAGAPLPELTANHLLILTSALIVSGVQMALPVMGALLLTDLTLGLLSKVAPQINVFFLGMPIKVWVGVMALMLTFPIFIPLLRNIFQDLGKRMMAILGA